MELKTNELKLTHPLIESNQLAFDEATRTLTHYISTETVNRYGYRLMNNGLDDTSYRKNPRVLYQHSLGGRNAPPPPSKIIAGKNKALRTDAKGIEADTEFSKNELGEDVMRAYVEGDMSSWSVGWDSQDDFTNVDSIPTMLKWEMLEYSAVIIPGNPDAVTKMLSYVKTDTLRKQLGFDFTLLSYKNEFDLALSNLSEQIKSLSAPAGDEKKITDFKNEIKSLVNNTKKQTTENLMDISLKLSNLESNLHREILSKMPNIVEASIRKYIGKVD